MTVTASSVHAAMQAGERFDYQKNSSGSAAAATLHDWLAHAGLPGTASAPGAAAVVTRATAGMLGQRNPVTGTLHLARLRSQTPLTAGTTQISGTLVLYDLLVWSSGLSGTSLASQAVNTPTLPARPDTTGVGVEAFVHAWTASGTATQDATITYTNQAGTGSKTTTVTIPTSTGNVWAAGTNVQIFPAAGDTGFRSIESFQLPASTLTAGDLGIFLARRIATIPFGGRGPGRLSYDLGPFDLGLPKIQSGAALFPMWFPNVTASGTQIRAEFLFADVAA